MKITFTKLPTTDGTIKVSLDGGQSFTEHNIADIHESGISLSDDQDFEKILIKGSANLLKNLDVISSVKVEGGSGGSATFSLVGNTKKVIVKLTVGLAGTCTLNWSELYNRNYDGLTVSDSTWSVDGVETTYYTDFGSLSSMVKGAIQCHTLSNVQLSNWVSSTSVDITADASMVGKTIELIFTL